MSEMKKFDTVIIGGGIGGLMAAYRLRKNSPNMKIAIVEKGNTLEKRSCPSLWRYVGRGAWRRRC